ncbi:MAG: cytochrome b/b6 domain-containing protein [Thermodesulfobacteriota bacterium]
MSTEKVFRHSVTVRWSHWLVAISGILLLFSGFGQLPMYPRYNVVKIPGFAWSGDFSNTLLLHYISAAFFTAAVVFHMIYHLRRREFGMLPKDGDMGETLATVRAMFGKGEEPLHGKFQAKQRMAYAAIGGNSLLLIVTGLIKSWKNIGPITIDPLLLQIVTLIHTVIGMVFMALFIAHIAALLLYRPLIPSMFTGRISKDYVREHHPGWETD